MKVGWELKRGEGMKHERYQPDAAFQSSKVENGKQMPGGWNHAQVQLAYLYHADDQRQHHQERQTRDPETKSHKRIMN